jgi:hypothetical protein
MWYKKYIQHIGNLPAVNNLLNKFTIGSNNLLISYFISSLGTRSMNGDINNCDNYRCLCLTSCFGKLFTSLLQNRLHRFLDDVNLYNRFQAGLRPDY